MAVRNKCLQKLVGLLAIVNLRTYYTLFEHSYEANEYEKAYILLKMT